MRALTVTLIALTLAAGGCGAAETAEREGREAIEDVKERGRKALEEVKERGRALGREAEKVRAQIEDKVNEVLADLEGVVPQADEDTVVPQAARANSFTGFLTSVLGNVDRYWVRTFRENDLPRPRVRHVWVPPNQVAETRCNADADDQAAFYCPADDTIYLGESIGRDILDGIGDFGVAYVVAHEYAHNVQQELGWYDRGIRFTTVKPFELQADCMAGAWGFAVYQEGRLEESDVEEAVSTAYAVGDFDVTNPQHHGTPDERSGAWIEGYETGDPSRCQRFTDG